MSDDSHEDRPNSEPTWPHDRGGWVDDLRVAAAALTSLPGAWLGVARPVAPARLREALRAFPLVGAAVGLAGGLAYWIAFTLTLPPLVAGFVAVAALAAVNGARRESGFARAIAHLVDASEENRGAIEAEALVILVGVKAAALGAVLEPGAALLALTGTVAASQVAEPALAQLRLVRRARTAETTEPVTPGDEGSVEKGDVAFDDGEELPDLTVALLLGVAIALVTIGLFAGAVALVAGAGALLLFALATGPEQEEYPAGLGDAAQQIGETAILVAAVAMT